MLREPVGRVVLLLGVFGGSISGGRSGENVGGSSLPLHGYATNKAVISLEAQNTISNTAL